MCNWHRLYSLRLLDIEIFQFKQGQQPAVDISAEKSMLPHLLLKYRTGVIRIHTTRSVDCRIMNSSDILAKICLANIVTKE